MEKLIELENNVKEQKNRLENIEKELKEFRAKKALDIASQILEQMITLKKMDTPKPSFEPGGSFINKKKPQFKEGEWMYAEINGAIAIRRYKQNEGYTINSSNEVYTHEANWSNDYELTYTTKATPEQIEKILTKVAEFNGYKEGVKLKHLYSDSEFILESSNFKYKEKNDLLLYGGCIVYQSGKWVTIIEQPKEKSEVEKFIDWYADNDAKITGVIVLNREKVYQKWLKSQK